MMFELVVFAGPLAPTFLLSRLILRFLELDHSGYLTAVMANAASATIVVTLVAAGDPHGGLLSWGYAASTYFSAQGVWLLVDLVRVAWPSKDDLSCKPA